jgi:hypothetical protein
MYFFDSAISLNDEYKNTVYFTIHKTSNEQVTSPVFVSYLCCLYFIYAINRKIQQT